MMLQKESIIIRYRFDEIDYYFLNAKREITERNMFSLKIASFGGVILALILIVISQMVYGAWKITWHYWLLIFVLAVFALFSFLYGLQKEKSYHTVQLMCVLFIIITIFLLILISILPFPEQPETFLGAYLILVPLFFILRPGIIALTVITGGTSLCIMAQLYKSPLSAPHDIFYSILSMVFSLIVITYTTRLRTNDFLSRERYRKLSHMDLLTGLLNKRSFEYLCQRQLKARDEDFPCALFVFDIDNFKLINDTYGHIMGDKVLEMIGNILSSFFRADDLVGRIGGDEFSAYICTKGSCEAINLRAERIISEIKECACNELNVEVSVSLGIAVVQKGPASYHEMFMSADRALYYMKRSKREKWKILVIR